MKNVVFVAFLLVSSTSLASVLTVDRASVTGLQVYETADNSLNVWLHINNSSRVGPNPANPDNTCELWTHDQTVYSTALSALMSGKPVSVRYRDRGEGTYWCHVVTLFIHAE